MTLKKLVAVAVAVAGMTAGTLPAAGDEPVIDVCEAWNIIRTEHYAQARSNEVWSKAYKAYLDLDNKGFLYIGDDKIKRDAEAAGCVKLTGNALRLRLKGLNDG